MPALRIWLPSELTRLREASGLVSSNVLAAELGTCRWTVLQKERQLGIIRPPRKIHDKKPSNSKVIAMSPFQRDEYPLPAGHAATWGLLLSLTPSLEGVPWSIS